MQSCIDAYTSSDRQQKQCGACVPADRPTGLAVDRVMLMGVSVTSDDGAPALTTKPVPFCTARVMEVMAYDRVAAAPVDVVS